MEEIKSKLTPLNFLRLSAFGNLVSGVIKAVTGAIAHSYFLITYGAIGIMMFFGKLSTIFGARGEERSSKNTVREHITAAFTILCLGILFISFSIFNYANGFKPSYTLTHAILIAACAFYKLALGIYGVAKYSGLRRSSLFVSKLLNLTDAAISLSITQSAILSAKHVAQTYIYDAISGILTGSAIVITALILLFSTVHMKK